MAKTHGESKSRAYAVWVGMHTRCFNELNKSFNEYGARGISVCPRWHRQTGSFQNFLDDMGEPPSGMSIDRINNDGPYSPANCRWASAKQQARNRRSNVMFSHNGKTQNITDWSSDLGLSALMVFKRIYRGWSKMEALGLKERKKWQSKSQANSSKSSRQIKSQKSSQNANS